MKMRIVLLFLLTLYATESYAKEQCTRSMKVVKTGQTCEKLAKENKVTEEVIEKLNGISCEAPIPIWTDICFEKVNITYECTKSSTITIQTKCLSLFEQANLTETQFLENNPYTSCSNDQLKIDVCSQYEPSSVLCPDSNNGCKNMERISETNNCTTIAKKYALSLTMLEEKYNCKNLISAKSSDVCVDEFCQHRYEVKSNMTCENITSIFKMKKSEIEITNDLKCGTGYLPIGVNLCVWPAETEKFALKLPDVSCIESTQNNSRNISSISKLAHNFSMTIDEFHFLNPNYQNSTKFCTKAKSSVKCVQFLNVKKGQSCEALAYGNMYTVKEFMRMNPTLRCDGLDNTKEVCIMPGYFNPTHCTLHTTLHKNERCSDIFKRTSMNDDLIEVLNPGLDCSKPNERKIRVCIKSFGMDIDEAHEIVANVLKNVSIDMHNVYVKFVKNPKDNSSVVQMSKVFGEAVRNETTYGKLKQIYNTNAAFKNIMDNNDRMGSAGSSHEFYCNYVSKTKLSQKSKTCFCDSEEMIMYCQSLATDEMMNYQKSPTTEHSRRAKRAACSLSLDSGKTNDAGNKCSEISCPIPLPPAPLEVKISGKLCLPDLSLVANIIDMNNIAKTIENFKRIEESMEEVVEKVIESSASLTISLCIIGSDIVDMIGIDACWHAIKLELALLARRFTVSTEINLPVLEARAKIVMHIPGLFDLSDLCEKKRFYCRDYCQDYDYYGSAEIVGKFVFGITKTFFEKKWNDPMESCAYGEYRVYLESTQSAGQFLVSFDAIGKEDFRSERYDGNYPFQKMKRYVFSFANNKGPDRNLTLFFEKKAIATFPVFGNQLERMTGKKQRKITYFTLRNSTIYYTSRREGGPETAITTVNWGNQTAKPNQP